MDITKVDVHTSDEQTIDTVESKADSNDVETRLKGTFFEKNNENFERVPTVEHDISVIEVDEPTNIEEVNTMDRESKSEQSHPWDVFVRSSEDISDDSNVIFWNTIFKITRVIFIVVFSLTVCGTAVMSKLMLLYMIAHINVPVNQNDTVLKNYNGGIIYPVDKTDVKWIWALIICMSAPYFFTLLKSLNRILFKKNSPLNFAALSVAICFETIHSVGLISMLFIVLPNLEPVVSCVVILNIVTIPSILKVYDSRTNTMCARCSQGRTQDSQPSLTNENEQHKDNSSDKTDDSCLHKYCSGFFLHLVAFLFHVGGQILICLYLVCPPDSFNNTNASKEQRMTIVILYIFSSFLISFIWWENFVPKGLCQFRQNMIKCKSKIIFISMCWKIVINTCIFPFIYASLICESECSDIIYLSKLGDTKAVLHKTIMNTILTNNTVFEQCETFSNVFPFIIAFAYIIMNGICFKISKAACKILAQQMAFGLPLTLATPVSLGILILEMSKENRKYLLTLIFGKCEIELPFWRNDHGSCLLHEHLETISYLVAGGILSFCSLLLTTNYIWLPQKQRLESTDKLFVKPLYCGILLDQSLILNRRRMEDECGTTTGSDKDSEITIPKMVDDPCYDPTDDWSFHRTVETPMIYMCATMWHEERHEMMQLLKSIIRMDSNHSLKQNLTYLTDGDKDYYEMQAHIFFDDAFEYDNKKEDFAVNEYVKKFIKCVGDAVSIVYKSYEVRVSLSQPETIPTPYGGQLIWKLPGANKLVVHLKNNKNIRNKKRWSQVMYMYYLLGHKLSLLQNDNEEKKIIAQNTFILALDGDVDFQPRAVQLLVDRMKKNVNVGAACGRILPIGMGPMVWYQKFEYAVSHWLQKAAENMIGCVLCSPGCFSLFRGSALMDENVMAKYTKIPNKAYQHVQYDQGEDRWLCTLLLKQGHKVEYVAASDALTFAPEGFYEFYNQRRRWSPSTMANIIDLIFDWRKVTTKNDDVSIICVAYQTFLLVTSLLTPGTILLMILGALYTAFPSIQPWTAFVVNIIPVAVMVLLCFSSTKNTQLAYAAIVSTIYAVIMMIVIVGLLKEAVVAKLCSVTTIFLLFVATAFVLSALLHPQEAGCIFYGLIYFLAIPSMSMLLMIYALGNINDVSWGTRDTKSVPRDSGNPTQEGILSRITGSTATDTPYSIGNMLRCVCCFPFLREEENPQIKIESNNRTSKGTMTSEASFSTEPKKGVEDTTQTKSQEETLENLEKVTQTPYWIQKLGTGTVIKTLIKAETIFWESLIETYLKPSDTSEEHKKTIKKELTQLRNKVCLAFLLLNTLFITIVYTLTEVNKQEGGSLSIPLPCGVPSANNKGYGQGHIEPISFAFTAVFGIILLIQFICMLFHRYSTLLHIISTSDAEINLIKYIRDTCTRASQNKDETGKDNMIALVKDFQKHPANQMTNDKITIDGAGENDVLRTNLKDSTIRMKQGTLGRNFIGNYENLLATFENEIDEKDQRSFIHKEIGSGLTHRSVQTIMAMMKNETLRKQIKTIAEKRTEQQQRLDLLQQNKRKLQFKNVGTKVVGESKPSVVNSVLQVIQRQKINEHNTEIKKMKEAISDDKPDKENCLKDSDVLY